jgi:hypothetical protein
LRSRRTLQTLLTLRALRAGRALRSLWPRRALRPRRAGASAAPAGASEREPPSHKSADGRRHVSEFTLTCVL